MKRLFVSYRYQDFGNDFILRINKEIERIGYELVSSAQTAIGLGDSLQDRMLKMIDSSSAIVAFLTAPSANVFLELGFALGRNKRLLVFADPDIQLPAFLYEIQYVATRMTLDTLLPKLLLAIEKLDKEQIVDKEPTERITLKHLKNDPSLIATIDHSTLEELIANWYRKHGYEVEPQRVSRDMGYDLVVFDKASGKRILVEVKKRNLNSKVNIADIRQLYNAIEIENADAGTIFSTSGFTGSAEGLTGDLGDSIQLKSIFDLEDDNHKE